MHAFSPELDLEFDPSTILFSLLTVDIITVFAPSCEHSDRIKSNTRWRTKSLWIYVTRTLILEPLQRCSNCTRLVWYLSIILIVRQLNYELRATN